MVQSPSRREFARLSAVSLIGITAASADAQTPAPDLARSANVDPKPPYASVKDFGALGDGITDDSAAVKLAYDSLKASGGSLFFPRGQYRTSLELTSRNIHIIGEGRGASVLHSVTPDGTILRALYRQGSWDAVNIADVSLTGTGSLQGNGFVAGSDIYQKHDEYTGSTFFNRVQFANLDKCISRPFGSIGLWVDGCQFGSANYHFWSKNVEKAGESDMMHAGCVVVSRCHMDYFAKAMFYLDSSNGDCGQIAFENNIFESGPGFVIYIKSFNSSGGVPGMSFRNNWNENTATGKELVIEGKRHHSAKFLYAENATSAIRFEDTPIGDCVLLGSGVETHSCSLQNLTALDADAGSSIAHHQARMFSGTSVGRVRSIAHPANTQGLRTPWFRMAVPKGKTSQSGGERVLNLDTHKVISLAGELVVQSVAVPDAGVFGGAAQRLSVKPLVDRPFSKTVVLNGSGWLVSQYTYKLIDGPPVMLTVTGTKGISGAGELSSQRWETLVNVSRFEFAHPEHLTLYHRSAGNSIVLLGGVTMVMFTRLQDAIDYMNSGLFPA